MRFSINTPMAALVALGVVAGFAAPADAKCRRMGFIVNDYGKDGPTKDAKELLDKHVAKWAAENGIEKYTIGTKDVKCELFLDVILFDEHTCTASANVCWDEGTGAPKTKATTADGADAAGDAAAKPQSKKAEKKNSRPHRRSKPEPSRTLQSRSRPTIPRRRNRARLKRRRLLPNVPPKLLKRLLLPRNVLRKLQPKKLHRPLLRRRQLRQTPRLLLQSRQRMPQAQRLIRPSRRFCRAFPGHNGRGLL
jgi:hypothetical protein